MMAEAFRSTSLWLRTLAQNESDSSDVAEARTLLRESLLGMRRNAGELVKLIPEDCKGLTVHDITHLDALWETADLIAGQEYPLNPAEAFVFGASVLIHDAGMTIAAFPGGLAELAKTTEWTDAVYAHYRTRGLPEPSREVVQNPPQAFREEILFNVLRALHARQAEELISTYWPMPDGQRVALLENQHLRIAYGRSIGRIAHSHHWDIERLNSELREKVGAATDLPGEWTVNEKVVACLLRCADAAHIDHRRAPSMLYALRRPKGSSDKHWRFQHKLNKVARQGDALLFSSGQDFSVDEAPAWWLCYDTIKLIDRELSTTSALLQDLGEESFAASRVYGAESPRILARHVRPEAWRPVDAEIRVSDPAHLAETLGGQNLYGRGAYAPIRELLQNAVDAVRARRRLEDRAENWGRVRLRLESRRQSTGEEIWLHVDDTGVGMSERVLVGPLLDFGKSIWNSPLLHEEFPGLESRGIKPIGKFGIGFFSIFMLGKRVKVVTRPYKGGAADVRVLEFNSLGTRPILRNAQDSELPADYTTRVSVQIENPLDAGPATDTSRLIFRPGRVHHVTVHELLARSIRRLVAAVDVEIEIDDSVSNTVLTHRSDWKTIPADQFLGEVLADAHTDRDSVIKSHEKLLSPVISAAGEYLGRAALWMYSDDERVGSSASYISVGGFLYSGHHEFSHIGVLVGETENVTRGHAHSTASKEAISNWASEQAKLIDPKRYQIFDAIRACHTILGMNAKTHQLPFCFSGGSFISVREFEAIASAFPAVHLPITKTYNDNFEFVRIKDLGTMYFAHRPVPNFIAIQMGSTSHLFSTDIARRIIDGEDQYLSIDDIEGSALGREATLVLEKLEEVWGHKPGVHIGSRQVFSDELYQAPRPRWVLSLVRE